MVKKLGATVAVALLLATSACGAGRPSADGAVDGDAEKGVKTNGQTVKLTKKQADCAAKIFVKSDLSDEALQALDRAATRRTRSPRRTRLRSRRSRTTWGACVWKGGGRNSQGI